MRISKELVYIYNPVNETMKYSMADTFEVDGIRYNYHAAQGGYGPMLRLKEEYHYEEGGETADSHTMSFTDAHILNAYYLKSYGIDPSEPWQDWTP